MTYPMLVALPLESVFLLLFWQLECLHPLWSMGPSWELDVPLGHVSSLLVLPSPVGVAPLSAPFELQLSSDGVSIFQLPPLGSSLYFL